MNFGDMRLPQLRQECKKRGAKIDDRKADLVERLEAYERNKNFGYTASQEPELNMVFPDAAIYRDINLDSPLPDFNTDCFDAYLTCNDSKMTKTAENLYAERYLMFCRWARGQSGTTFIKSKCQAQMKSGVMYVVDIEIDSDSVVVAAQCECAAGMGPSAHCKHVSTVLCGLCSYKKEGYMKTFATCTQTLQQFHATKRPQGGSPVKVTDLKLPFGENAVFDPRPPEERNLDSYSSHFLNTWKACPKVGDRPVSQLFSPTNMHAYAHDHGFYCEISLENRCLSDLKVVHINETERTDLEINTRGQAANKLWLMERTKRLRSSSFGRICKLTERTDAAKFARELTECAPALKTRAISHGKKYEPVALQRFARQTEKTTKKCGIFVCLDMPYLGSSPDSIVEEQDGSLSVVEVKCPYSARDYKLSPSTVPYLVEEEGVLRLKEGHDYFFQVQGQMLCTGAHKAYFVIFSLVDFKILTVFRDNNFIENMKSKLKMFFENHFKVALLDAHLYRSYSDSAQVDSLPSCTE